MNLQKICVIFLIGLGIAGCTSQVKSSVETNTNPTSTPQPTVTASPTPTIAPTPTAQPATPKAATPKPTVSATVKSEVKSYSTTNSNSTTNININSNGTNVKINVKNGKRYAELNGKEVELDANGCYDYDQNGTKIHSCVNN